MFKLDASLTELYESMLMNSEKIAHVPRCSWVSDDPAYIEYHDAEWGVPVGRPCDIIGHADRTANADRKQFEFLLLEGAQAGLSWISVLKRRAGYARAFYGFDASRVAAMSDSEIAQALEDPGIIRNRLKVRAAVNNAQVFLEIQREFGSFSAYIWQFVAGEPVVNRYQDATQVPATSPESYAISADLKRRGMRFVGATIMYAHMQATGLFNDHTLDCFRWTELGSN